MGVLQNARREMIGPLKLYGLTALNSAYPAYGVANTHLTGPTRNINAGTAMDNELVSLPSGNRHPNVWMMPQKPGALAARNTAVGDGEITNADIWAVKLASASISGSGDLTAIGGLIIQLVADITGSGTISAANLQAFLQLAADIGGDGDMAGALTGLGELLADLTGAGDIDAALLTALGELSADIVVTGTGLTTANVGPAVWASLAATNNVAGTMGEKLNDAGSAANPWTEIIEGGFTAAQILKLLAAAAAGKLAGAPAGPIEITGVDGSTVRINATVDSDGNRISVTYDVS